jgi:hypothetical protein
MSDWFGLSQLTSKSMPLEGRQAALIPQLHWNVFSASLVFISFLLFWNAFA